jgi:putative RecB family exonuclease
MNDEPHLSVSQLRTYMQCPLQYFFRYVCGVERPPTPELILGRTIHETLHDNYRQKIESHRDLPLSQITDIFSDHWDREVKEAEFQDDENSGHFKDQGIQLPTAYHQGVSPVVQPIEVEKEFLFDTGVTELPLKGYIDLIDDQHYIIDHKTSKRSFPKDAADRNIQLTAYALAHRKLYGDKERGVRMDIMVKTKQPKIQQLQSTRSQADIDRFLRLAKNVEDDIKAGIFYPNENYMCSPCGYREMCDEW